MTHDCIYMSWFWVFCGLLCLVSHSECFVWAFVMWSALTREICPVEGGLVMCASVWTKLYLQIQTEWKCLHFCVVQNVCFSTYLNACVSAFLGTLFLLLFLSFSFFLNFHLHVFVYLHWEKPGKGQRLDKTRQTDGWTCQNVTEREEGNVKNKGGQEEEKGRENLDDGVSGEKRGPWPDHTDTLGSLSPCQLCIVVDL